MKSLSRVLESIPVSAPTAVDTLVKQLRAGGTEVISFCVGEPDFDTPAEVAAAGVRAIENGITKYTHPSGTPALRAAAAEALEKSAGIRCDPSCLIVTTGGKYAVYAAVMALCDPGDEVIVPAPYWPSYLPILRLAGVTPVPVASGPETGWKITASALEAAVTEKTKAFLLNNPVNPTGAVYFREDLAPLAEVCVRHDLYAVTDEVYSSIVFDGRTFCPFATLPGMAERTVTVFGVSKTYAMTGWRIGFAAAPSHIAPLISVFVNHTTGNPSSISQEAALTALHTAGDETREMCRIYEERRNAIVPVLNSLPGICCTNPEGAFYLLADAREAISHMPDVENDLDLAMKLLEEERVAVVPCADYGAPGFLRLSYTLPVPDALEGLRRMERFIRRRSGV